MSFGNQPGQVKFVDVTAASGFSRQGQTWGITLFDYNGDGLLDPFQNNHQQKPLSLFRNRGDGTFIDIVNQVLPDGAPGDFHGAISIDYDNDGVAELFQVAGGDLGAADDNDNKNNRFFVRQGNQFVDMAEELGLSYPLGRGRMPVPFDFNDDGRLDIVYTGPARPDGQSFPTIFLQEQDTQGTYRFVNQGLNSGLDTDVVNGTFALLGDVTGDHRQELIYVSKNPAIQIYDTSELPLNDVTASVLPASLLKGLNNIKDIVVADFNGDTFQDLFIIQQGTSTSGFRLDQSNEGRAKLSLQRDTKTITFKQAGDLSLNFQGDPNLDLPQFFLETTIQPTDIYIGSGKINPNSLVFTLDDNAASSQGMPSFRPGVDRGVFIGFDQVSNQWSIQVSSPKSDEINFLFETQLQNPTIDTDFNVNLNGKTDRLLTYDPELGRFVDSTAFANLDGIRVAGRNAIAADLDNDGDQDIFMVATANIQNLPDELFENLGDGRFRRVPLAAGAAGTDKGIGDAVVVGDYDVDGFLDLFVTNGDALGFDRPFWLDGTNQLFQNQGNSNHSLQIDLVGTTSNRDAVGAKVYVTTSDGKRQVREQNGGVHNRGQNFPRLHFGLGDQAAVQSLEVIWPDGSTQVFNNLRADRVIQITQNRSTIETLFQYQPKTPNLDIDGTSGNDKLRGSEFDNVINGFAGNDVLKGLRGRDTLLGGNGDDYLVGGPGRDVLNGGAGRDEFVFTTKRQGGDRIQDFSASEDDILIKATGFKAGLTKGPLSNSRLVFGARALDSGDRFIYNRNRGELFFDPDGSGNQSATLLATLDNNPILRASDIVVF